MHTARVAPAPEAPSNTAVVVPQLRLRGLDMKSIIAERNRVKVLARRGTQSAPSEYVQDQVLAEVIPKILPRQAGEIAPELQHQPSFGQSKTSEDFWTSLQRFL